jgi:outer membrane protein assembly factor BamB
MALVGLFMVIGHLNSATLDPLKSPEFKAQKEKLRANPLDEPTKQRIRELDLQIRQQYFRRVTSMQSGVWLLLGGAAVFVVAGYQLNRLRRTPPMPAPKTAPEAVSPFFSLSHWSVATSATFLFATIFLLSRTLTPALPDRPDQLAKLAGDDPGAGAAAATPDAATAEELAKNWPAFRGFNGASAASATNFPVSWDPKTGANVAWKTPVPARGFGSPIIFGDRVFLSGGDAEKREVLCYNLKTGAELWRQPITNVAGSPTQGLDIPESTGYAAPTMATDGRRVYAIFANGDLAALTLEGKVVWTKGFGLLKNAYGHAISLATWQDRVIVQLDQGDADENKSKLYAIDGRTGQVAWQRPRKFGASWASPVVFEAAGKPQVVVLSLPHAVSYNATDGTELWRADCLNGEVTPSPAFANGHVLIASPADKLLAVRPDGQGDVTKSHVGWSSEENVPDVTSPASNGELVFTVTTPGLLTCFDAKDGKKLWEHDFEMECHATPAIAGNRVYLLGQKGVVIVVEAGREFKQVFRTDMAEAFHASPAFASGRIVLRSEKNLWCLAEGAKEK